MKLLVILLTMVVPTLIVGGTLWAIIGWSLSGWLMAVVAFGGLLVGTLMSFILYWFLWRRPMVDDDDDSEH